MRQSSAKPADGGSNATGPAAMRVQTSHKRQRLGDMRVLDRPAVPRQPGQHCGAAAGEAQLDKAGMAEQTLDDGGERPEPAGGRPATRRGGGGAVFRARAMIAGAEGDGDEAGGIAERHPAGEPDLDRLAARGMRAAEARRQGRGVVGDDQIAGREQARQRGARQMRHAAVRVDGEQPGATGRSGLSAAIMRCTPACQRIGAAAAARRASFR